MSIIKCVIFDWDGTLLNSLDHIVYCFTESAKRIGIEPPEAEAIKSITGLGINDIHQRLMPSLSQETFAEYVSIYREILFASYEENTRLFEGGHELIARLREQGKILAIATAKSRKGLDLSMQQLAVVPHFATTRCAEETAQKPDPLMLHQILDELGFNASEAVMIGDTEFDLQMGKNAGMACIGVTYGAHPPARLAAVGPNSLVHHVSEIDQAVAAL